MNFKKSKVEHSTKVQALRLRISDLFEIQKELYQQVRILDEFSTEYNKSKEKLANEIVSLQYEFLKNTPRTQ